MRRLLRLPRVSPLAWRSGISVDKIHTPPAVMRDPATPNACRSPAERSSPARPRTGRRAGRSLILTEPDRTQKSRCSLWGDECSNPEAFAGNAIVRGQMMPMEVARLIAAAREVTPSFM